MLNGCLKKLIDVSHKYELCVSLPHYIAMFVWSHNVIVQLGLNLIIFLYRRYDCHWKVFLFFTTFLIITRCYGMPVIVIIYVDY